MTATRMLRVGTIVLAVAVWFLAAVLLWRTTVPGLRFPDLHPRDYFGAHDLARAREFSEFTRYEWLVATVVQLTALVMLAWLGRRIAGGFELGRVGTGVMVGAAVTTALWLVGLPFGFLELWWERRYGLSTQSYGSWVLEQWPSVLGQVVGLTILLTILLLLAGRFRRAWWAVAAPLVVGLGALVAFVIPLVVSLDTDPVRDPQLRADVRALEHKERVTGTPVRIQKVSDTTRAVNAETIGFGPTTRVVLWDTLVNGRFDRGEIRAVTAHELGHVQRRHIWRGIGWSLLFSVPFLALTAGVTRRRGGMALPENVPLALLTLSVLGLALTPLANAISRRYETEADWISIQTTRDPSSQRKLFRAFTTDDLADPNPPFWSYVLLDDHPTTMQRIAMTRAWQRRQR